LIWIVEQVILEKIDEGYIKSLPGSEPHITARIISTGKKYPGVKLSIFNEKKIDNKKGR